MFIDEPFDLDFPCSFIIVYVECVEDGVDDFDLVRGEFIGVSNEQILVVEDGEVLCVAESEIFLEIILGFLVHPENRLENHGVVADELILVDS